MVDPPWQTLPNQPPPPARCWEEAVAGSLRGAVVGQAPAGLPACSLVVSLAALPDRHLVRIVPWPEHGAAIIDRIDREWDALDRVQNIADTCWFDRPAPAATQPPPALP